MNLVSGSQFTKSDHPPDSKCAPGDSDISVRSRHRNMSTLSGCGRHVLHSDSSTDFNTLPVPLQADCLSLLMCDIRLRNSQCP